MWPVIVFILLLVLMLLLLEESFRHDLCNWRSMQLEIFVEAVKVHDSIITALKKKKKKKEDSIIIAQPTLYYQGQHIAVQQ